MDEMMRQRIYAALRSPDWTDAEKWVLKWQWQRALGLLVDGFLAWSRGDLAGRLHAAEVMD